MIAARDVGRSMPAALTAVEVDGFWKTISAGRILRDVSFVVPRGTVFGLVGPPGSGKSTLIRTIATLETADAGRVVVGGVDVRRAPEEVRRIVGYMPQEFGSYPDLTVVEFLDFYGSSYGIRGVELARLRDDLLDLMDLVSLRHAAVGSLPSSARQRLSIARALLHDPSILVLDEPTQGMDFQGTTETLAIMSELTEMGKTVLIASRSVDDLKGIPAAVGVLENGSLRVRSQGSDDLGGDQSGESDG